MHPKSYALSSYALGLALGMALYGCNQPDPGTNADTADGKADGMPVFQASPLDKEVLAIKARHLPPEQHVAALRDLLRRYGRTVPDETVSAPQPASFVEERPESGVQLGGALAKTAQYASYWSQAKSVQFTYNWVNQYITTVAPGKTIQAWTERTGLARPAVDPMLMAFYSTSGDDIGANTVNIPVLTDDASHQTVDPSFAWTNNTGNTVVLHIMAFCPYNGGLDGEVTLAVRTRYTSRFPGYISASPIGRNNPIPPPIAGCSGPTASRLTLNLGPEPKGQGVLALNISTMRGAYLNTTGKVQLQEVLAGGFLGDFGNMILPYFDGPQGYPGQPGDYPGGYTVTAGQEDRFSCPFTTLPKQPF
jgi:hypothetical protein